jgi:CheY-like chemotaxis protein
MAQILIVDDEPVIGMVLEEILAEEGHHVHSVLSGFSALEILGQEPKKPDLLLIDLFMPGMGGKDFLQIITHDPQLRDIPVILLTGSGADMQNFPVAGSYRDIIGKPFDIADVVKKVNYLLISQDHLYGNSSSV